MAGILENVGLGLADSALGVVANTFLQSGREHSARKMARYNDRLNRSMLVDSAALQKAGMYKAGISPAAMGEGFRPAGQAGQADTPMQGDFAPSRILDSVNLSLQQQSLENQTKATNADADLKREQARQLRLQNDVEQEVQDTWRSRSGNVTVEKIDGVDTVVKEPGVRSKMAFDVQNQYYSSMFERSVLKARVDSPDAVKAALEMPILERNKVAEEIKQLVEQHGLTNAMKGLTLAQTDTEQWRKSLTEFEAKLREYEYEVGVHTDFRKEMVNIINRALNGDVGWQDAIKLGVSFLIMYLDNRGKR